VVLHAAVGGMDTELRRSGAEDQPPVARVDVRQLEDVAQESAVGVRVGAVEDRMRADDPDQLRSPAAE